MAFEFDFRCDENLIPHEYLKLSSGQASGPCNKVSIYRTDNGYKFTESSLKKETRSDSILFQKDLFFLCLYKSKACCSFQRNG